ncbi:hypothetical protein N9N67_11335, partial [Bacteriovoracaceae bacterium]|nr:hypothetical protein [Bacteriovoracaceae bacterium]
LKRNNSQVKLVVKDIFGTITQKNIHTFQKLNPMMDVKKKGVGAGIGLNLAWRNSSSLIFNIQKDHINSVQIGQYLGSALEEKRRKFGKIFHYDLKEDQ